MSPGPRGALAATGPDRAERIARTMNLWRWDSYTSAGPYRSSGPTGGMPMTARRGREPEIGGQQPGPG